MGGRGPTSYSFPLGDGMVWPVECSWCWWGLGERQVSGGNSLVRALSGKPVASDLRVESLEMSLSGLWEGSIQELAAISFMCSMRLWGGGGREREREREREQLSGGALDLRSKGGGFEPWQERQENFLLHGQLHFLCWTLISVPQ